MSKTETLKTVRSLTPDEVLCSRAGRLKIALLQLITRLLPGRFAIWLSLLDEAQLERQVRIKFGLHSLVPGSSGYDVPRLHLIVERRDWLALQEDASRAIQQSPDNSPSAIDDNQTIVVAGRLRDGTFDLQVQSGLRGLALNIYAVEEIKRVVCNGQEVEPKRIGAHSYAAELRLQGALEFS